MRGCVTKKGKRWYIVLDVPAADGRRRRKWHSGYPTKKVAEDALPGILESLQKGTYIPPNNHLTVKAFLADHWLPHVRPGLAATTAARYQEVIDAHLVPGLGDHVLAKLTPLAVQRFYRDRLEGGRRVKGASKALAPRTVLHMHRLLREALGQAVRWQLVARNVCDAVEPPRVPRTERPVLDEAQVRTLLATAKGTVLELPVTLALTTGLRRGEIFGLRWADVDLDAATLTVRQALEKTVATVDGRRTVKLTMKPPKTAKGRRTVALPPLAVAALRAHKAEQAQRHLKCGYRVGPDDLVLMTLERRPVDPDTVTKAMARLVKNAKLPAGLHFHDLRHCHASLLLKAGVNLRVLADRLGHSSPSFTLATYAHVVANEDQEAAAKLEAALKAPGRTASLD